MKAETISDILREMRESGEVARGGAITVHAKTLADRIEAAVRRIRSRCYAALDGEYDCAHGYEIREAFKGEVNDDV